MHQLKDRYNRNEGKKGFTAGQRVQTPDGPGEIVRETINLYLMRPGAAYLVKLDNGGAADYNENDLSALCL